MTNLNHLSIPTALKAQSILNNHPIWIPPPPRTSCNLILLLLGETNSTFLFNFTISRHNDLTLRYHDITILLYDIKKVIKEIKKEVKEIRLFHKSFEALNCNFIKLKISLQLHFLTLYVNWTNVYNVKYRDQLSKRLCSAPCQHAYGLAWIQIVQIRSKIDINIYIYI